MEVNALRETKRPSESDGVFFIESNVESVIRLAKVTLVYSIRL